MNKEHLQKLSDEELVKGLTPLINHAFWAYFEELLRREQHKQVSVLTTQDNLLELGRAQGRFEAYQMLASFKSRIQNK